MTPRFDPNEMKFAKQDEALLWAALLDGESPREAGRRIGIAPKRVDALCAKWSKRGIYDYGVAVDLGWHR